VRRRCGRVASERETEFGYFAGEKKTKLSASEVPGEVVGSGEEDLRCRSLLTYGLFRRQL